MICLRLTTVITLLLLTGCSGLPNNTNRPISREITHTYNKGLYEPFSNAGEVTDKKTEFLVLDNGLDAFAARALLSKRSNTSIDAQYYMLHDDLIGRLFLSNLLNAADRGVRVRLLLDDIALKSKGLGLTALDSHTNFAIRVFNPFSRRTYRAYQYLSRFGYITRRMHNKAFIVDRQATILGGRNIGNEYFEAHPKVGFGDLDVLLYGPIALEVEGSFEDYWDNALAYPLASLERPSQSDEDRATTL